MMALSALALLVLTQAPAAPGAPAEGSSEGDSIVLAPKAGFFQSTSSLGGAPYLGLEVGYVTPLLQRRLALVVEGSFHQPETSGTLNDPRLTLGEQKYTLTERELAFMLSAVYRFERAWGSVTPYAGAGPGLYLHRATTRSFGATTVEKEGTVGFQFLGGTELHLGPGGLFLEAHYHFTQVSFVTTGKANVGGILGSLGYRLRL